MMDPCTMRRAKPEQRKRTAGTHCSLEVWNSEQHASGTPDPNPLHDQNQDTPPLSGHLALLLISSAGRCCSLSASDYEPGYFLQARPPVTISTRTQLGSIIRPSFEL